MERSENEVSFSSGNESQVRSESALHRIKMRMADQISRTAQVLHQKSLQNPGNEELSNVGHRTADWLERSADYLRELEPDRLKSDLEAQVRRNPGRSLLIAGAVGLVLGRILRRK